MFIQETVQSITTFYITYKEDTSSIQKIEKKRNKQKTKTAEPIDRLCGFGIDLCLQPLTNLTKNVLYVEKQHKIIMVIIIKIIILIIYIHFIVTLP